MINKRLNSYLKSAREESGLNRPDLCKKAKIGYQYLWNMERGFCVPSIKTMKAYIKYCGANKNKIGDLFKYHIEKQLK